MAIHCIAFVLGTALLMFRLLVQGPDVFFLMDAMLIAIGSFCVAHATTVEKELRDYKCLFRQQAYENEQLQKAIADYERLKDALDC